MTQDSKNVKNSYSDGYEDGYKVGYKFGYNDAMDTYNRHVNPKKQQEIDINNDINNDITPERVCKVLEGMDLKETSDTSSDDNNRELLHRIARFVHISNWRSEEERCINPHEDWIEEFKKEEERVALYYYTSPADRAISHEN